MSVNGSTVEGYLSGREGDSLRLALPGESPFAHTEIAVPLAAASRIELHVGQKRHTWQGALIGAVVLGLTGVWDPIDTSPTCSSSSGAFCSRAEAVAVSVMAGAALGGLVGHATRTDQWTPVALEALAVMPPSSSEIRQAPGGPGLPASLETPVRVSVRF
jgi:hypothetical protein